MDISKVIAIFTTKSFRSLPVGQTGATEKSLPCSRSFL